MIEKVNEQFINECIGNIKPDLPDSQLAHVIMCGEFPEAVVLGTAKEAREELAKFDADCWLSYAELIDQSDAEELAIYGFAGWLTTRDEPITIGAKHCAASVADLVKEYLEQVK